MLITLLVTLLVIAVIVYAINLVIDLLNLPQAIKTIALIIVGIIALAYILNLIGVSVPLLAFHAK